MTKDETEFNKLLTYALDSVGVIEATIKVLGKLNNNPYLLEREKHFNHHLEYLKHSIPQLLKDVEALAEHSELTNN